MLLKHSGVYPNMPVIILLKESRVITASKNDLWENGVQTFPIHVESLFKLLLLNTLLKLLLSTVKPCCEFTVMHIFEREAHCIGNV